VVNSSRIVPQGGDPPVYRIQENTPTTFQWSVNVAAVQAVLTSAGSPVGEGVPIGSSTIPMSGLGTVQFVLTAQNNQGQKTSKTILVVITEQDPPNPPFNVNGNEQTDVQNTITWDWTFDPAKRDIIGFRVYRADLPGNSFAEIADENDLDKNSDTFVDTINPTCGRAYYVVAVYQNSQGVKQETSASANSWYSAPCP
jgi:hypothetical protein